MVIVRKSAGLAVAIACSMAMAAGAAFAQERDGPMPSAASAAPGAGEAAIAGTFPAPMPPSSAAGVRGASATEGAPPAAPGSIPPPMDATMLGKQLLNAGPDPRVQLDGRSKDHAAIFGTEDEDEQGLLDQERALQAQRDQLKVLERVLNAPPPNADPHPPAMIPLTPGGQMTMPPLMPTPSGSQLNRTSSQTQRSVDDMQRRVDELRRGADTLRQGGR
ncbi:hypothetical protein [Achromobacter animicus]|uniref:hypothetical protein n=1 Tax=Achromobacter animicus TaxID=1389935 RepID=UPI0020C5EC46|nr:hypothetical protein [Achromobacter animicus]